MFASIPGDSGRPVVLIVDDDPAVLALLRRILSEQYEVLTAADGREAIALCQQSGPIALLLVDVIMLGLDGTEVVSRCRQYHPGAAYLYMSGYTDTVLQERGVNVSAHFLRKPFRPQELLEAVRSELANDNQPESRR